MKKTTTILLICTLLLNLFSIVITNAAESQPNIITAFIFRESFNEYEVNSQPDMEIYESQGSVLIEAIDDDKFLSLKTNEGLTFTSAEKSFNAIEDKVLRVSFEFKQDVVRSNDNLICGLYNDTTEVVGIYTRDGKIYCNEEANIILDSYQENEWVNVSFEVDLIENKVNCNGNSYDITPDSVINKYKLGVKYSPGFSIDDIELTTQQEIKDIIISGNGTTTIPSNGENSYKYSASGIDTNDFKTQLQNVEWSLLDSSQNALNSNDISLSINENNDAIITIKSTATTGRIILKAKVTEDLFQTLDIDVESIVKQNSYIDGSLRIAGDNTDEYIYSYELKLFDQNGDAVADYGDYVWSLDGEPYGFEVPEYITIDNKGNITVKGETPHREFIDVIVSSQLGNFEIRCKVLVTDILSYMNDTYRYNAVKNHVDTVLREATDIYHGTPLLSDFISVYDDQAGKFVLSNGEAISTSNFESQSSLLKTMECLSNIEHNSYYQDKSVEYAKYMIDNYRDPFHGKSLLSGGHLPIDMELQGINLAGYDKYVHESKGINTFYKPLFSADPEFTSNYIKALVLSHSNYEVDPRMGADRHWYLERTNPKLDLWYDRSLYKTHPGLPIYNNAACTFTSAYSDLFNQLAAFYTHVATDGDDSNDGEKHEILGWIDIVYDTIDCVGYNPLTGEYTGLNAFTTTRNYNPFESTYDTQTNIEMCGKFNLNQGTPDEIQWYDRPDYNKSSFVAEGDRLYLNVIDGKQTGDSWSILYKAEIDKMQKQLDQTYGVGKYQAEQFFIEPYFLREGPANFSLSTALSECFDAFALDPDNTEAQALKVKISKKYVHAVYNAVNLLYDFDENCWRKMMTFGIDLTDWIYPHDGYYGDEGKRLGTKKLDAGAVFYLCKTLKLGYDILETIPEEEYYDEHLKKTMSRDRFKEMLSSILNVAKDIAKDKDFIGDIGNPFEGEAPDLDYTTPSTDGTLLLSMLNLYAISGNSDYLDLATVIGNNYVSAKYDDNHKLFMTKNSVMTTVSNRNTHILLALEAMLLDRYDEYITIAPDSLSNDAYMELNIITDNTGYSKKTPPSGYYAVAINNTAKPIEIEIEPSFSLFVGDRKQISYKILPFDASQTVLWDSTNRNVATVSDTGEIVAVGKGTTKVRCVSKSNLRLASKEITVTVK